MASSTGYLTFGPVVASDVLRTYPSSELVAVARIAISVVVTFSYPLQSHPSRGCILSLLAAVHRRCRKDPIDSSRSATVHVPGAAGATSLYFVVTTACAMHAASVRVCTACGRRAHASPHSSITLHARPRPTAVLTLLGPHFTLEH